MTRGIIPNLTTDKELAFRLGWTVQRVRKVARNAGTCYILGRSMLFKDGDVAVMEAISNGTLKTPEDIKYGPPAQKSFVYFVRQADFVKIGWSAKWRSRVSILQTANPNPIEVLAVYRGGPKYEKSLHERFAAHHVRAEWFSFCDEIAAYIEANKGKCVKDAKSGRKR
jgi:hypothetical protein